MSNMFKGVFVFGGTFVLAFGLYLLTAPTGLPWNASVPVTVSAAAAALAGGLVGAIVTRCFGWRVGVAAALAWTLAPAVWNHAVTGGIGAVVAAGLAMAGELAQVIFLLMTRRAREIHATASIENNNLTAHDVAVRRAQERHVVSWALLSAAVVFAVFAAWTHDYRLGEAASAYARAQMDEAGNRFVILNGIADEQMVREEENRNRMLRREGDISQLLHFRDDAAYRTQLVAYVRRTWPTDTNLWAAAQIGPAAFADAVFRSHPDRVYTMTGKSTTPSRWAARWAAMAPYLGSKDGFIPLMRRAFAIEGNTLANRLQGEGRLAEAWKLYLQVYDEIDPGNLSALVNLTGMLERGYEAEPELCQRVNGELRGRLRGGLLPEFQPVWGTLIAWNNEMIQAYGRGNLDLAAVIARKILSRPEWRTFIPANAVMGSVMARDGDYSAAETFFRAALAGKGTAAPQPIVMNDYADTLRNLKRYDEAEAYARRAIAASGGRSELFKLTLAEILRDAGKPQDET